MSGGDVVVAITSSLVLGWWPAPSGSLAGHGDLLAQSRGMSVPSLSSRRCWCDLLGDGADPAGRGAGRAEASVAELLPDLAAARPWAGHGATSCGWPHSVIDVMASEFVTHGHAQGLTRWRWSPGTPAQRAAATLNVIALNVACGRGVVVVESVFNYPGLGS